MTVPLEAIAVVALFASLFTGAAAYRLLRERALRRGGVRTYAVVGHAQDLDVHSAGDGVDVDATQTPVVEFTTGDGRTVRARSKVSSSAPNVAPGRTVTVFYNPREPSEVALVGYGQGTMRLFLAIGIVLFALDATLLLGSEALLDRLPLLIPVVLGIVFLGIGGYGVNRVWGLRLRGGRADGVVVGETRSSTQQGLPLYHPRVRYRLPNGHEIESASERGRTLRRVRQGQAVRVCYDRTDPHRVVLSSDGPRPVFVIFAVVGIAAVAIGAAILRMVLWP